MRALQAFLLGAAVLATGSCGLTPLYAERTGVAQQLSAFQVETGAGRAAYLLRQQLVDRFGARQNEGDAVYRLDASVQETRGGFGVRVDDVVTRYEITMNVRYVVTRLSDGAVVRRGQVSGASSYDAPGGPYADITVEERARERAAILAADRLRLELSLHFAGLEQT